MPALHGIYRWRFVETSHQQKDPPWQTLGEVMVQDGGDTLDAINKRRHGYGDPPIATFDELVDVYATKLAINALVMRWICEQCTALGHPLKSAMRYPDTERDMHRKCGPALVDGLHTCERNASAAAGNTRTAERTLLIREKVG